MGEDFRKGESRAMDKAATEIGEDIQKSYQEPEYKRLQRKARESAKKGYMIKPANNKPGVRFKDMTGTEYEVQQDGSWRRVRR